jgi:hypothetical protein
LLKPTNQKDDSTAESHYWESCGMNDQDFDPFLSEIFDAGMSPASPPSLPPDFPPPPAIQPVVPTVLEAGKYALVRNDPPQFFAPPRPVVMQAALTPDRISVPVSAPSALDRIRDRWDVAKRLPALAGGYLGALRSAVRIGVILILLLVLFRGGKILIGGGETVVNMGADGQISSVAPMTVIKRVPGYFFSSRPDVRDAVRADDPFLGPEPVGVIGVDVRQITNELGRVGLVAAVSTSAEDMSDADFREELLVEYVGGTSEETIGGKPVYISSDTLDGREMTFVSTFYENQLLVVGAYGEGVAEKIASHMLAKLP